MVCKSAVCTGADPNLYYDQRCTASWGTGIAGRGIGMRYREELGDLKSKILESVYSIRDIQIFGAGNRKMEDVMKTNSQVNKAALGLTLHRQTIASFPNFFIYLGKDTDPCMRRISCIKRHR